MLHPREFDYSVFSKFFAYFFGKACWIGARHERLREASYFEAFGNWNRLNAEKFQSDRISKLLVEHFQYFFWAGESNLPLRTTKSECFPPQELTEFQKLVGHYYGHFETSIPKQKFRQLVSQALLDTGWHAGKWSDFEMTDEKLDAFVRDAVNFRLTLPSNCYELQDMDSETEALLDLAIVVDIVNTSPQIEKPPPFEDILHLTQVHALNLKISDQIRDLVMRWQFPDGLKTEIDDEFAV